MPNASLTWEYKTNYCPSEESIGHRLCGTTRNEKKDVTIANHADQVRIGRLYTKIYNLSGAVSVPLHVNGSSIRFSTMQLEMLITHLMYGV